MPNYVCICAGKWDEPTFLLNSVHVAAGMYIFFCNTYVPVYANFFAHKASHITSARCCLNNNQQHFRPLTAVMMQQQQQHPPLCVSYNSNSAYCGFFCRCGTVRCISIELLLNYMGVFCVIEKNTEKIIKKLNLKTVITFEEHVTEFAVPVQS